MIIYLNAFQSMWRQDAPMDSAGMQLTDELHRSYGQCYLPLDLQTGGAMVHSYVSLISALLCKSEPGLLGSYFN